MYLLGLYLRGSKLEWTCDAITLDVDCRDCLPAA